MIGHRTRFRENGDLPPWRGSAAKKKKPPFFNARALMTREIMGRRDAQCNTGNDLKRSNRGSHISLSYPLNSRSNIILFIYLFTNGLQIRSSPLG